MAKIAIQKQTIVVKLTNKNEVMKCMNIPMAKCIGANEYEFPHESLMQVLGEFYHINTLVDLQERVKKKEMPEIIYKIAMKYNNLTGRTEQLKKSGPIIDKDSFLFAHQQLCRQIALINPRYGFFCEAGTGKTPMTLQMIVDDIILHPNEKRHWLVVCPLSLIQPAWITDSLTFFPWLKVVSLHGNTPAQTRNAFKEEANIYIINYESFRVKMDQIKKLKICGVVVDESSKLKSYSSEVTKQMLKFSTMVEKWYDLSGTPAPNTMMEYYAQMKMIDPLLLGKSYTAFKARWFYSYNKNGFVAYDITPESKQALTNLIKQKAIFIAKKDCLDLPEKVFIKREVEMPNDLKKMYDKMKNELYCIVEQELSATGTNHTILATTALTSLMKLNQLTSGIIMDENSVVHYVSNAKLDVLNELLEELGSQQVVIWANFHGEFEMLKKELGDKCVTYYGGTTKDEIQHLIMKHYGPGIFEQLIDKGLNIKDMAVKLFKEGKVQYFLANSASAAYGLTLTNASYAIYYSLNYSYEKWSQSNDRIHRFGQKNTCTYYSILMKDSIDYVLDKCLKNKGDLSMEVLEHLKPQSIGGV